MSAPKLEYITRCRVPGCTKEFISSPFDIPIIGQPDQRLIKFVTALMEHTQKKHPTQMLQISGSIQQFTGFLVASTYEIQDPQIGAMQEGIRAALHKMTQRLTITDEEIQDRVARLELEPEEEEGVALLLRDMRDLLTESGRYAPQVTEKPLVTAV